MAVSGFSPSRIDDSLTTVRRRRRRGKPEQSQELTRIVGVSRPSGGDGTTRRRCPDRDRGAEARRKPRGSLGQRTSKGDRSLAKGSRKRSGGSRRTASQEVRKLRTEKGCASIRSKSGST